MTRITAVNVSSRILRIAHSATRIMPITTATNTQFELDPLRGAGGVADTVVIKG
jgi:hypothetical protein